MWQDVRDELMSSVDPCIWACYDFAVIGAAPPGDLIMCNIAGYVGTEPAAPLLLEMIERQEGLAGGYYTGIVTLADGRLHCAKVVGDTATLRAAVRDLDLPGTMAWRIRAATPVETSTGRIPSSPVTILWPTSPMVAAASSRMPSTPTRPRARWRRAVIATPPSATGPSAPIRCWPMGAVCTSATLWPTPSKSGSTAATIRSRPSRAPSSIFLLRLSAVHRAFIP